MQRLASTASVLTTSTTKQHNSPRYVVISPVRDEEEHLERTITCMLQQIVRPVQWILVNDGSSDGTANIIERYASRHPWITAVHRFGSGPSLSCAVGTEGPRRRRAHRAREAKEIEAFYEGFANLTVSDWQFLVKLDGDLGFEPDYFANCLAEFNRDRKLGIAGGVICHRIMGELQVESTPRFHVRGATKIYRRACWDEIEGVLHGAGWDTMDEVKANMLGWSTRSLAHLKVEHFRFTGAANGSWQNAVKNGIWAYICGYHPAYMLYRCARRIPRKPYLTGSVGLLYGFVAGYIQQVPQVEDKSSIRYLRDQQLRRISFRPSIWK